MNETVSKRYAKAFFSIWQNKLALSDLEKIVSECEAFSTLLKQDPKLSCLWYSSGFNRDEKKGFVSILKTRTAFSEDVLQALEFLIDKKRTHIWESFVQKVQDLFDRFSKTLRVEVTSARELSREDQDAVKKTVQSLKVASNMNCSFVFRVNESMLGGMIIKMGQYVYDYSIRASLDQLRRCIENLNPTELASRSDV